MALEKRSVFTISDGTGITAETFAHSVLSQFSHQFQFAIKRRPYVNTISKAKKLVEKINQTARLDKTTPIIFTTAVKDEIIEELSKANAIFMDIFGHCVKNLEKSLDTPSENRIGSAHVITDSQAYYHRMEAIDFTLAHDDGQFIQGLDEADLIFVGISRCGKTPTSLYLAMQYALKVANFPLIPEDFSRGALPQTLIPHRKKLFGLTTDPARLCEVRQERMPNSKYASLEQCYQEIESVENLMRREGIQWINTSSKSIEEIATKVLQILKLNPSSY